MQQERKLTAPVSKYDTYHSDILTIDETIPYIQLQTSLMVFPLCTLGFKCDLKLLSGDHNMRGSKIDLKS